MSAPAAVTRREAALVGALVAAGAIAYLLLNASRRVPDVMLDEILYGQMAKGIAAGEGATWRGQDTGVQSAYSYLISLGWIAGGGPVDGYVLGRSIGVVVVCLTAVPAWMLGREVVGCRLAWVVPVGAIAGSWMVVSGRLLTENLAYPLATAALAALVMALARQRDRRLLIIALLLSLATCLVRMQLLIMPVAVIAAIGLDLLRTGGIRPRAAFASRRVVVSVAAAGALIALAALLALATSAGSGLDPLSLLGRYRAAVEDAPDIGGWLYWISNCSVELALMTGVVPVVAFAALATSGSNWRDPRVGALLAVAVPFTLLLVAQVAWFHAANAPRLIDRYLIYAVPLMFAALAVAPGRVGAPRAVPAAVVLAGLALALPVALGREADALAAMVELLTSGAGRLEDELFKIAAVMLVVGAGGALLLAARRRRAYLTGALVLTALAMTVVTVQTWVTVRDTAGDVARLIPDERDWVDRAGAGPSALVSLGGDSLDRGYLTEFFNDDLRQFFVLDPVEPVLAGSGFSCVLRAAADGRLLLVTGADPDCRPAPRALLPRGFSSGMLFADVERVARPRGGGDTSSMELVVSRGSPRARAVLDTGCGEFVSVCRRFASLRGWLDQPADAVITLRPGRRGTRVRIGDEVVAVTPADRPGKQVRVRVPPGRGVIHATVVGRLDESTMPLVDRAELYGPDGGADLLYESRD